MLLHTFQKNFPFAVTKYIIVEMLWGNQAESGGFTGFSFDLFRVFPSAFSDIFRYENPVRQDFYTCDGTFWVTSFLWPQCKAAIKKAHTCKLTSMDLLPIYFAEVLYMPAPS